MFRQICAFGLMVLVSMPAMALKIGEKAPDFKLTDTNGTSHSLSQNKGKWVVLEWYNPGCPFVVRHYKKKTMTTLASEFGAQGVEWLAVDSSHFVTSTSGADFSSETPDHLPGPPRCRWESRPTLRREDDAAYVCHRSGGHTSLCRRY